MPSYTTTPGGNLYPLGAGTYDQSQFWLDVQTNRDQLDTALKAAAISDAFNQPNNLRHAGALPAGTDVRMVTESNIYRLSPNGNYTGLPAEFLNTDAGVLLVIGAGVPFTWGAHIAFRHGSNPGAWWHTTVNTSNTWNSWVSMTPSSSGGGSGVAAVGMANNMRQQAMRDHYGPISTGGKGAVLWRFDHYLNVFNSTIRSLFESRGMKYCLALDSRRWDHVQNNQVTKSMVNGWVQGGLAEIWNHGTDHEDHTGYDALFDFFVNSKTELETDLPAAKIWGFIMPGPTRLDPNIPPYDGLGSANSIEAFTDTVAGQLLLKYHAVSSGAFPGTAHRIMDGNIRQGQSHYGIETATASQMIAQVDSAIANKKAVQFMMHPDRINQSGKITLADLTTVMDYVKTKIDAGELANLSPYESMLATV